MIKEKQITDTINKLYNVDIFTNSKKQNLVDLRSLACYILHKDLKHTLHSIKDWFIFNGKTYDHATVLHSARMFDQVLKRKPEFHDVRAQILQEIDPKFNLIKIIEGITDEQKIIDITNCIKYTR